MEEMQRQIKWEGVQNFHTLSEHTTVPKSLHVKSPCVHQPEAVRNGSLRSLWRFHYPDTIDQIMAIGHRRLIQPLNSPWRPRVGLKRPTCRTGLVPILPALQKLPRYHKLRCEWKAFVITVKTPLLLLSLRRVQGLFLLLKALCQKQGQRPNIYFLLWITISQIFVYFPKRIYYATLKSFYLIHEQREAHE